MKPNGILLMSFGALAMAGAASSGCGGGTSSAADPGRSVAPGPGSAAPKLIHSPPISQLTAPQLRSLSMECDKYPPDKSTRGPYDAAYCEKAMAAWADSPLQIITIDPGVPSPPAPAPSTDPAKSGKAP